MSALPPKANICTAIAHVCFGSTAAIIALATSTCYFVRLHWAAHTVVEVIYILHIGNTRPKLVSHGSCVEERAPWAPVLVASGTFSQCPCRIGASRESGRCRAHAADGRRDQGGLSDRDDRIHRPALYRILGTG